MTKRKIIYSEPADYFPEEVRKLFEADCGGIEPLPPIEKTTEGEKLENEK